MSRIDMVCVCVSSTLFLLPWQFSQFVLATQCLCLLVLYVTRLLPRPHVLGLYWSVSIALLINIVLQFGNSLLLTSLFPCTVMACLVRGGHTCWFLTCWLLVFVVCMFVCVDYSLFESSPRCAAKVIANGMNHLYRVSNTGLVPECSPDSSLVPDVVHTVVWYQM